MNKLMTFLVAGPIPYIAYFYYIRIEYIHEIVIITYKIYILFT